MGEKKSPKVAALKGWATKIESPGQAWGKGTKGKNEREVSQEVWREARDKLLDFLTLSFVGHNYGFQAYLTYLANLCNYSKATHLPGILPQDVLTLKGSLGSWIRCRAESRVLVSWYFAILCCTWNFWTPKGVGSSCNKLWGDDTSPKPRHDLGKHAR